MCIIAYIPQGKQIKEETIRIMFSGNPDGAGIMWKPSNEDQVQIRKGFMKVDDLIRAYNQIPVNCEKAIHCRIATSGKVSVDCCHPFPVRRKIKSMKKAVDVTDVALMHNGIISWCTPSGGMSATHSDTMEFAQRVLNPLKDQLDNQAVKELLKHCTTSRLLIFRKSGRTLLVGDWQQSDGIFYSNSNYKASTYNTRPYSYSYEGYSYENPHPSFYDDARNWCYWHSTKQTYGYWDKTASKFVPVPNPSEKKEAKKPEDKKEAVSNATTSIIDFPERFDGFDFEDDMPREQESGYVYCELGSHIFLEEPSEYSPQMLEAFATRYEVKIWRELELDGNEIEDVTSEIDYARGEIDFYATFYTTTPYPFVPSTIGGTKVDFYETYDH